MQRLVFVLASLLLTLPVTGSADELWRRAVSHYDSYSDLVPSRMTVRFDQYNGRGKLVSSDYSEIELGIGPGGRIEGYTVYAEKDGEDVTRERRDDSASGSPFGGGSADNDNDSPFAGLMLSPFDPEQQTRVTVTDTGRTEMIDGTATRVHTFRHATSEKSGTTGIAWLDNQTGMPVRVSARVEPLPSYVDELEMTQLFGTDSDGRWFMTRMAFRGEGNILFIRRRVVSEFEFQDYFTAPPESLN